MTIDVIWLWVAAASVWVVTSCIAGLILGRILRRRETMDAHIRERRLGSPRSNT